MRTVELNPRVRGGLSSDALELWWDLRECCESNGTLVQEVK